MFQLVDSQYIMGMEREVFDALFMFISLILLVWHSTKEILLFRQLKLFGRIYIDWKFSRLRRKLINLLTKFIKTILSLTGNISEGFWNWPTNRFFVTILASVSFSVECIWIFRPFPRIVLVCLTLKDTFVSEMGDSTVITQVAKWTTWYSVLCKH